MVRSTAEITTLLGACGVGNNIDAPGVISSRSMLDNIGLLRSVVYRRDVRELWYSRGANLPLSGVFITVQNLLTDHHWMRILHHLNFLHVACVSQRIAANILSSPLTSKGHLL